MEQYSHYLMMMKHRKHQHMILNSIHFQASVPIKSWEEQAFVQDSQGPLGGFIWPPRSYSCSFCKREFRSAQALGGHMNVHRRDRARLKQSSNNSSSQETQVCSLDSNPNNFVASAPTNIAPLFSSPIIRQAQHNEFYHSIVDSKKGACKRSKIFDDEDVETNLCVGLNIGHVSRIRGAEELSNGGDGKKRKTDVMKLPIMLKTCSNDKEIDLELRLGDSPTVK